MGFGYVEYDGGVTAECVREGSDQIQVAGDLITARASIRPIADPPGDRVRM
jgi:hypothetical protein